MTLALPSPSLKCRTDVFTHHRPRNTIIIFGNWCNLVAAQYSSPPECGRLSRSIYRAQYSADGATFAGSAVDMAWWVVASCQPLTYKWPSNTCKTPNVNLVKSTFSLTLTLTLHIWAANKCCEHLFSGMSTNY